MTKRHIAHIMIEAETPLKVGSSSSDFLQDSPIQKDWNGLPMILGTSIAGVLRKEFDEDLANDIFGKDNGSKVIFSNALLVDSDEKVHETLLLEKNNFLKIFDTLPIREHTAITQKGVAKEHSKYDEEVVYKGSRFKFSIELLGEDEDTWKTLLNKLALSSFRLGGGSTKGFGKFNIIKIKHQLFDITDDAYADISSSLNEDLAQEFTLSNENTNFTTYTLKLTPDDFFMFGSGFGDDDADQTPVYEEIVDYEKGELSSEKVLIPASSIKGAIAHRTTYHYNLLKGYFIGGEEQPRESISELFGSKADNDEKNRGSKGKVLFSDIYQEKQDTKVFDHVKIDRFTGGAMDGALFQEKTVASDETFEVEILVEKGVDETAIKAFEKTLDDICSGMLPLGGATTKGHGVFTGEWR